jgi:serine/threonine protein kinase
VLFAGQVLDNRYEILEPIAEGGMGAVFRARRLLLGDEVAIKVIAGGDAGPTQRERFLRESRAAARLRHPNIVAILDFDIDPDGNPFLVMELLNGASLRHELDVRGRLSIDEIRRIVPPLCSALQLAHAAGIVHRDLKPANIVAHQFGSGERVHKLVDFGVASVREGADDTRLTAAYQFLGTMTYASPEQLTTGAVDSRSDVYALGAVVFELLAGRPPFEGATPMSVVAGHLTKAAPSLRAIREDVPEAIDAAVARALAKSPDERWGSAAEFGAALAASGEGAPARPARASSGLDAYDVAERLAPGRLGSEVFRGVHRALGHPVAIRVLRRTAHQNWDGVRARFLREAKTLQVAHPSIIQVRDYGEEPDLVYVVTDFIDGPSLRELLDAAGQLEWTRLRPLAAQMLEAARVLHRRNGLLCGLTPEIIRVSPADDAAEEPERLLISSAGIWQAQDLLATVTEQTLRGAGLAETELRYVAPELLTGRAADVRSDVFTLGVLIYEMATGTRPYDGHSLPELLGAMLRGTPGDPRRAAPSLPAPAAAALSRALAPVPENRFATARECAAALQL